MERRLENFKFWEKIPDNGTFEEFMGFIELARKMNTICIRLSCLILGYILFYIGLRGILNYFEIDGILVQFLFGIGPSIVTIILIIIEIYFYHRVRVIYKTITHPNWVVKQKHF